MILFYHSMDEFQTTNEWSIIVLKQCTTQYKYSYSMQHDGSNEI